MTYIDWIDKKKARCSEQDMLEHIRKNKKKLFKKGSTIHVKDRMQNGYSYKLEAPPAKKVSDLWVSLDKNIYFKPMYLPQEMLQMGVFGGKMINDCIDEFPHAWFLGALRRKKLSPGVIDYNRNKYKVKSGTSLSFWRSKKWIRGDDPRGWFQWYCRYTMGRRHSIDEWQMRRWWNINRFYKRYKKSGGTSVVKQLLLQWSWPQN